MSSPVKFTTLEVAPSTPAINIVAKIYKVNIGKKIAEYLPAKIKAFNVCNTEFFSNIVSFELPIFPRARVGTISAA
ncbi:hypothetical protein [Undibacterium umbellatum]|uniref:Uncharacterized protein n=1 Tax=Undibacterium umbellatum TaxID=2762300 RepID=A0ABR6Z8X7_9BURK|nr:hypothetical protein [Undibacterium umbellatum]MBC3908021.1 hypothetical protein [Undibacterium umbellatum]